MRIMVCLAAGRPVAVFTDLDAGDRWLAANLGTVDVVFVLEDGRPTSEPLSQALPAYITQQRPLDGHVPKVGKGQHPAL
jgi:hypothetical protein